MKQCLLLKTTLHELPRILKLPYASAILLTIYGQNKDDGVRDQ